MCAICCLFQVGLIAFVMYHTISWSFEFKFDFVLQLLAPEAC